MEKNLIKRIQVEETHGLKWIDLTKQIFQDVPEKIEI